MNFFNFSRTWITCFSEPEVFFSYTRIPKPCEACMANKL